METLHINGRTHLIPEKGYRLTEGDGVYPLEVILEVGEDSSKYYEVPESEYERILVEREKANIHTNPEEEVLEHEISTMQ